MYATIKASSVHLFPLNLNILSWDGEGVWGELIRLREQIDKIIKAHKNHKIHKPLPQDYSSKKQWLEDSVSAVRLTANCESPPTMQWASL